MPPGKGKIEWDWKKRLALFATLKALFGPRVKWRDKAEYTNGIAKIAEAMEKLYPENEGSFTKGAIDSQLRWAEESRPLEDFLEKDTLVNNWFMCKAVAWASNFLDKQDIIKVVAQRKDLFDDSKRILEMFDESFEYSADSECWTSDEGRDYRQGLHKELNIFKKKYNLT